jgi:hypothetical protein
MKYSLLILSVVLVIAACSKVDVPKSHAEILRDGTRWGLADNIQKSYRKFKTDKGLTTDTVRIDPDIPECKRDDYLVFREGNDGGLNTGDKKCPQGEAQEENIRWGFTNNDSRMYIYQAGNMFLGYDDVEGEVTNFSDNKFTIKYMVVTNLTDIPRKDTVYYTVSLKKF